MINKHQPIANPSLRTGRRITIHLSSLFHNIFSMSSGIGQTDYYLPTCIKPCMLAAILEMKTSTNHTADSIILSVVNESLNWEDCHITTIDLLLANITLHDSCLKLISITDPQEAVLLISLDIHWNKSVCEEADITRWTYLIVRLSHVVSVWTNAASHSAPIGNVNSEKLDDGSFQKLRLFANENKLPIGDTTKHVAFCKTVITDVYGGERAFIHGETIELLLVNAEGKYLNVDPLKRSK